MRYWVGVTDNNWFDFLRARHPDEVNFWQPSPRAPFTSLPPGSPFLFKLRSPHNHIAGGGYFLRYTTLPISLAWDAFGEKNGTLSRDGLTAAISRYRDAGPGAGDFEIGCTILAEPFFFEPEDWIPMPEGSWSGNIVRGKIMDGTTSLGARLWDQVMDRVYAGVGRMAAVAEMPPPAYGADYLARTRLGQGSFRVLVTDAYQRRCAITGENILPVLEAAHIKPFSQSGPMQTTNGMLLRSDFHKLFDLGLVTVTPSHRVEVSSRIREEWYNGKAYYRLHGRPLAVVPNELVECPSEAFLQWHNENVYAG
jgi:putative restriction endonuclease